MPILALSLFLSGCCHTQYVENTVVYSRPMPPVIPALVWHDIEGYYGLSEKSSDFDNLQLFFDEYEGYLKKVDDLLKLYEKEKQ